MKRLHMLPSAAWVNGGNIQIPVKDLPALAKVKAIVLRLEGLFTTGAAAAAIASNQLFRLISMVDVGNGQIRGSGAFWHFLEWQMRGGETNLPGGLPAANAEAHRRHVTWVIPFYDRRARAPADGCPHGADFREGVISVDTAAFASLGAGTWDTLASIAGTLRCFAILDEPNESPAAQLVFGYADLTGQSPTLPPGLYTDLFVYRESVATVSSAEVATVGIQADGQTIFDASTRLSEYARLYNDAYALGSDVQVTSATAPVGGERLPETPAYTAAAADTVTGPFLPLIFPAPGYKLTKCVRVEQSLRVDYTGTDTTMRVGFRKIAPWSDGSAVAAFARIGKAVSPAQILPKTDSKGSLSGRAAHMVRYMPLRAK